jgi:excisionase family DNA binding protein
MTEMPTPIHKDPLPQRDWLTVPEAAAIAEVSERTIRAWCRDHRIGIMVGGRWRVSRASLNLILAGDRQLLSQ